MFDRKKLYFILILFSVYSSVSYSQEYKRLVIDRDDDYANIIENEIYGNYESRFTFSTIKKIYGNYFTHYFYQVNDDNLCLGLVSTEFIEDKSILYINTEKTCGSHCKVLLSNPKKKQIYYLWEPGCSTISDDTKVELIIRTNKEIYSLLLRKGITDLEFTVNGNQKIKSIRGLEKFPNLLNLTLNGFDYVK